MFNRIYHFADSSGAAIAALLGLGLLLGSASASAATPNTTTIEAALTSAGGGAAADGTYQITFALYDGKTSKAAVWTEGPVKIPVVGGRFQYRLGLSKVIGSAVLAGMKSPWFGVKIGTDPELSRQPLSRTFYAAVAHSLSCTACVGAAQLSGNSVSPAKIGFTYAGSTTKGGAAKDLACTGCVSVAEMKFDGDINLGGNNIKAKNATFSGGIAAATVTAGKFFGDGSQLTGIKIPQGSCSKPGEVVGGINANGTLKCVPAVSPQALPKDGIDEISNGLLNNQFTDTISADKKKVVIPDNTGTEAVSDLNFPDIGVVQAIELWVHVENTDLSKISIIALPPLDKKVGYTLCDPCGKKDAKILKQTWSPTAKPKSGDLATWIGKNPKGLWNLKVLDSEFCVIQAQGNTPYCFPAIDKKTDGWIADWSIKIQTLSTKKVGVKGNLVLASATTPCDRFTIGGIRYSKALGRIQVCDGTSWWPRLLGTVQSQPGLTCKDIKTQAPSAKSGVYWIDPDGKGNNAAFKVYCDQETGGGGWTMVVKVKGNDGTLNRLNTAQWRTKKLIGACDTLKDENALCTGYDKVPFTDVMIRSLSKPWRNLAWSHRDMYASMWAVVNAGKRVFTKNRLFGSVNNLGYNGDPIFHRECGAMTYGFLTGDYVYNYSGIAGHTKLAHGHAGGVVGASLSDWRNERGTATNYYSFTALSTTRCVTDFSLGGGYGGNGKPSGKGLYAINAHWWGNGNVNTWNWNTHVVFLR